MHPKVTADRLRRRGVVYVRQSQPAKSSTIKRANVVNTN